MFKPRFTLSNTVLNDVAEIERQTARLSQAIIPTELLNHIRKQCRIALTHYSTQIEGNQLSIEQVSGVIEGHKTYGLVRDEKEVQNYFAVLQQIPGLIDKHSSSVTSALILHCHKEILKGIVSSNLREKFRDVQNAIYEAGTNKLVYLPPEAKDVQKLIDDLCEWTKATNIHPVIQAAIFHNQFVTIHPFVDGNGRTARLLTLYLLDVKGYEWRHLVPIDRYYADDRRNYYSLLQGDHPHNYYEGRTDADFTAWIEYYVDGIKRMLSGTINQMELYRAENILMNNRQTKVLNYLENKGAIAASEYSRRFNISRRMAARDLKQLVEWGKLIVIGKARTTKYILKH